MENGFDNFYTAAGDYQKPHTERQYVAVLVYVSFDDGIILLPALTRVAAKNRKILRRILIGLGGIYRTLELFY